MQIFQINELINSYQNLPDDAFIFASKDIIEKEDLTAGNFLVLASDEETEYEEIEGEEVPIQAFELGMLALIEVTQFKDIIDFQKNRNPNSTEKDYMEAIEFYLSYEDFLDDE